MFAFIGCDLRIWGLRGAFLPPGFLDYASTKTEQCWCQLAFALHYILYGSQFHTTVWDNTLTLLLNFTGQTTTNIMWTKRQLLQVPVRYTAVYIFIYRLIYRYVRVVHTHEPHSYIPVNAVKMQVQRTRSCRFRHRFSQGISWPQCYYPACVLQMKSTLMCTWTLFTHPTTRSGIRSTSSMMSRNQREVTCTQSHLTLAPDRP